MKATDLLIKQHRAVARLFKAIEAASAESEKERLFKELASNLAAHDGIERHVFYPACKEAMGLNDDLGEALVEHGVIEFSLYQANEAVGAGDFAFKVKVLKELVEHHVKEEEEEFFPMAEKALGESSLEALGDEMEEAFEEALSEDFQAPLYESLRQVMAGVLETAPANAKKPGNARRSA
jgi:hemerythrin-like domain-containing protein